VRRLSARLGALALALFATLASCDVAFARGGGGGHGGGGHSSGGGGSHSSGGFHSSHMHTMYHWGGNGNGGGGGGFFLGLLFFLVPTLVFVVICILVIRTMRRAATDNAAAMASLGVQSGMRPDNDTFVQVIDARALQTARPDAVEQELEAIAAADPAFEPETFLQRAEMAFFLVSRAYQHADAAAARPYLTAEAFEQWRRDVDGFAAAQKRPILDDLNVRGLHVVSATHGEAGDEIVVHFDLVYRMRVFDASGTQVSDEGEDRRRGQRWTFRRQPGVTSLSEGGVVAMKCPQCGAPLELAADGHCKFCRADISAGAFDWTVAAISQAAFEGARPEPLFGAKRLSPQDGFAAIAASDPQFDGAAFIERVRGAFVALQQAWAARDLDVGRGFMSLGLYYGWSAQVETMAFERRKNIIENVHISAIAPVAVLHGGAFDDVTVRIDASCVDYEIDEKTGAMVFGSRSPEPFTEFWTFQRSTNAKTPEHGLLDKRCPNCGAPLDVNQIGECRFCKAAVTSGKFDWVLSRIEQAEEVTYA